jgi:hypothetical protein
MEKESIDAIPVIIIVGFFTWALLSAWASKDNEPEKEDDDYDDSHNDF